MHACMFVQYNMPACSSYLVRCWQPLKTNRNALPPSVHHVSIHLNILGRCALTEYDARDPRFLVFLDERQ